jgi:5-enolpyruvylshikimate-3-phosphate synthase
MQIPADISAAAFFIVAARASKGRYSNGECRDQSDSCRLIDVVGRQLGGSRSFDQTESNNEPVATLSVEANSQQHEQRDKRQRRRESDR